MEGLLVIGIIVIIIWMFVSSGSKNKAFKAISALDEVTPWLTTGLSSQKHVP